VRVTRLKALSLLTEEVVLHLYQLVRRDAKEFFRIWVLGAEPPVGSRGRAPGQGVRSEASPDADAVTLLSMYFQKKDSSIVKNVASRKCRKLRMYTV